MFFKKKNASDENVAKKSIKSMDAVVTGVILGGVIASLYGVKKLKDREHQNHENLIEQEIPVARKKSFWARIFGK